MIRYSILALFVASVAVYAYRDWFKSLCILICMMAIIERPDMPKGMLGVPGLNPFNLILINIIFAYFLDKERKLADTKADNGSVPIFYKILFFCYFSVVIVCVARMLSDMTGIQDFNYKIGGKPPGTGYLIQTYWINGLKWFIPAILLYFGAKDEERWRWAMISILVCLMLFALQIIRQMPLSGLTDGTTLQQRAVRVLGRNVGYHRVDLSTLMSGAVWCFFIARMMIEKEKKKLQYLMLFFCAICALAMILTGGRTGIGACAILGAVLTLVRYRILLLIGPAAAILLVAMVPAIQERIFEGFDESSHETSAVAAGTVDDEGRDLYAITSGRVLVWPEVIAAIEARPWVGYGTKGMLSSYTSQKVMDLHGDAVLFRHPHNAYLELLLDAGILGAFPIFLLFLLLMKDGFILFVQDKNMVLTVSGGVCFSLILTQLLASIGAQTFYPREGVVLMWCSVALMLRAKYSTVFLQSGVPKETAVVAEEPATVKPLYAKLSRGTRPW